MIVEFMVDGLQRKIDIIALYIDFDVVVKRWLVNTF